MAKLVSVLSLLLVATRYGVLAIDRPYTVWQEWYDYCVQRDGACIPDGCPECPATRGSTNAENFASYRKVARC